MKIWITILLGSLILTPASQALTDKGQEAFKKLEVAMAAEIQAQKSEKTGPENGRENMRPMMLSRLKTVMNQPNLDQNQREMLNQLSAYFTSDAVQTNLDLLQEEIRLEQVAEDNASLKKIQDSVAQAAKVTREAKTPADLDATIADLGKLRGRGERSRNSDDVRAALNQVEPTLQFVIQWQNYLAANSIEDEQAAQESLRNLSSSNGISLIPRSELLRLLTLSKQARVNPKKSEKFSALEAVQPILAETKSLADVEKSLFTLRQLQANREQFNGMEPVNSLIQSLQSIDKPYQDFKAGLTTSMDLSQNYNGNQEVGNAVIARLKSELWLLLLPRFVGAPEGTVAKPGEDVSNFLDRLAKEAKERGDINVGIQCRQAQRLLRRGDNVSYPDQTGLTTYIAGQNQELAGQYMLAVVSYQTALKSGSELLPAKIIGERLAGIKSAHEQEYAEGMKIFLTPPQPIYRPGMMPPDMNPRMAPPESPRNQSPALLIPPVPTSTPTPEPTAKKSK